MSSQPPECPHGVPIFDGCSDCDYFVSQQPTPHGSGKAIADLVCEDIQARKEFGTKKYGEPLMANNGRDALVDAYQEALDLCQYLKQAIEERKK